ncbi:MAG: hypothetical protein ACP5ME_13745 [Anaerolineae bacterium]
MSQTLEERVTRLEVMVQQQDREITELRATLAQINNSLSSINSSISAITVDIKNIKDSIQQSQRYSMWKIGILVSTLTVIIDTAAILVSHL